MKVTIDHKEKHSEDIFTPGRLVICSDNKYVVIVTGEGDDDSNFAGVNVSDKGLWDVGNYDTRWDKDCFKKFVGTIKLEQE